MKPQSAKQKGRLLQQKVRDVLRSLLGPHGCVDGDIESRGMGQGGSDVILSPLAKRLLPVEIECKSNAQWAVYKPYEQAKTHGDLEPILVVKANRKEPLVVMSLDYWIKLERHRMKDV
jgi:hypothetical protein